MTAVRGLLHRCIDYAGLFPPAGLDLETTVRNFEAYRSGPDAWALGRLVLQAAMLPEFVQRWPEFVQRWPVFAREWPMSVLLSENFESELQIAEAAMIPVDVVEVRIGKREVAELRRRLPMHTTVFIEVSLDGEGALHERLEAVREADCCAKVRTGGIIAGSIPSAAAVATFLEACVHYGLRFKATAGLHHPVAAEHRLTYTADSATAHMHGFMNVLLASSMLLRGATREEAELILKEEQQGAFRVADDGVQWRDWSFTTQQILELRERLFMGFGSCSFTEPLDDLRSMGWLA